MEQLIFMQKNFKAGQLQKFANNWSSITSDAWILKTIKGAEIEFTNRPYQRKTPFPITLNNKETDIISSEISQLLDKQVIELATHCPHEYISNIFIRPKKDGGHRVILNLAKLNEQVQKRHFKMQTLTSAINLITPQCFMASIDWKDAYYSVPVASEYRKYLRFGWQGKVFQFTCLPNGLSSAPRLFTKITKPLFSHLTLMGHLNSPYIDDVLVLGETKEECRENVKATINLSLQLGFVVHPRKSVLEPTQEVVFLGFILNSRDMIISLTPEKATKLKRLCLAAIDKQKISIRTLAQLVGQMVATFPGVERGKVYYRRLDNEKSTQLQRSKGNYETEFQLPPYCLDDLHWWVDNIENANNPISHEPPSIIIQSDASKTGWGGVRQGKSTGGSWSSQENQNHINYLELLAAFLTLKALCSQEKQIHIMMEIDNTTAVSYINNMGGTKKLCNDITREIWEWCFQKEIWLSARHLPGHQNTTADAESRRQHDNTEWQLNPNIFKKLIQRWPAPSIDLFASRLNCQIKPFISWKPDPEALLCDAFTSKWTEKFYAFPPFSLISKVLVKIENDHAEGILIAPWWPTQPWFAKLARMIIDCPVLLPRSVSTLLLPQNPAAIHPLLPKMTLTAFLVSGNHSKVMDFQNSLKTSLCPHGETLHKGNTTCTSDSGYHFAVRGMSVLPHHLLEL